MRMALVEPSTFTQIVIPHVALGISRPHVIVFELMHEQKSYRLIKRDLWFAGFISSQNVRYSLFEGIEIGHIPDQHWDPVAHFALNLYAGSALDGAQQQQWTRVFK